MNDAKQKIFEFLEKAKAAIPSQLKPNLPPGKHTMGAPEWYEFEYTIWNMGEEIRQLFLKNKLLRSDVEIQNAIVRIATDYRAKRGRQSFIMLLGNVACAEFAPDVAEQLTDGDVRGHAIDTLTKMKCSDYSKSIEPFTQDSITWVKNKAKRYVEKYGVGK